MPLHFKHVSEKQKPKGKRDIRGCTKYLRRNRRKNETITEERRHKRI
jgi:hypothetical protein